jgi:hypothetical protein
MAAVSARRMRGPNDTAVAKGRARRRSRSSGEKPPSGPIRMVQGPAIPPPSGEGDREAVEGADPSAGVWGEEPPPPPQRPPPPILRMVPLPRWGRTERRHRRRPARLVAEHQPPAGLPAVQQVAQLRRLIDHRHVQPPRLFRRLDGDGVQPVHPHMLDLGPVGDHQPDPPRAQLRCLFDGELQRALLHHADQQFEVRAGRLRLDLFLRPQHHALLENLGDDAAPRPVAAVEDQQPVPELQPHHLGQIARLVQRRQDGGVGGQGRGDVEADHAAESGRDDEAAVRPRLSDRSLNRGRRSIRHGRGCC